MSISHIVLFKFKTTATAAQISDVTSKMLALKHECIHPASQTPYIVSSSGGVDNSIEGLQNGMTHAFIVEFASLADRNYYVNEDPAHDAFKTFAGRVLDQAQVVDFTNGVFDTSSTQA